MNVKRHDLHPAILATGRKRIRTDYGTVHIQGNSLRVTGNNDQLYEWTNRPGARWPGSTLLRVSHNTGKPISAILWKGDLVDIAPATCDIDGTEFDAWCDDVLGAATERG